MPEALRNLSLESFNNDWLYSEKSFANLHFIPYVEYWNIVINIVVNWAIYAFFSYCDLLLQGQVVLNEIE